MAKTFDGPPTLERSGSEHRVGRLHPSFLRREGLVRMWSSLWLKGDGGNRKNSFFTIKEGRDDFRNSFTHFIRDRYNLSYNMGNWIHETNDDIKPLDLHAKPF